MSLFNILKNGVVDFGFYVHDNLEEVTAIIISFAIFDNIDILNQLIKSIFAIITALISSYLVHELKKNQFNLVKMVKSIIKKVKRNEKKPKQNIK